MRSTTSIVTATCVVIALSAAPLGAQRGRGASAAKVIHGLSSAAAAQSQGRGPKTTPPGQSKPKPPETSTSAKPASSNVSIQEHLNNQPQLRAKLQTLLPGTNLNTAAIGFSNFGRFVSAVHLAHNLGIPFDQLKLRLTGPHPMSLGEAVHALSPTVNASAEVRKAEAQAKEDMKSGERE